MIRDGVMYAELRPMLLDKSIPRDDGVGQLGLADQMSLIVDAVREKQARLGNEKRLHQFPFGLKVVYCTPRSICKPAMERELRDCIHLKLRFPDLICGRQPPPLARRR